MNSKKTIRRKPLSKRDAARKIKERYFAMGKDVMAMTVMVNLLERGESTEYISEIIGSPVKRLQGFF